MEEKALENEICKIDKTKRAKVRRYHHQSLVATSAISWDLFFSSLPVSTRLGLAGLLMSLRMCEKLNTNDYEEPTYSCWTRSTQYSCSLILSCRKTCSFASLIRYCVSQRASQYPLSSICEINVGWDFAENQDLSRSNSGRALFFQ